METHLLLGLRCGESPIAIRACLRQILRSGSVGDPKGIRTHLEAARLQLDLAKSRRSLHSHARALRKPGGRLAKHLSWLLCGSAREDMVLAAADIRRTVSKMRKAGCYSNRYIRFVELKLTIESFAIIAWRDVPKNAKRLLGFGAIAKFLGF